MKSLDDILSGIAFSINERNSQRALEQENKEIRRVLYKTADNIYAASRHSDQGENPTVQWYMNGNSFNQLKVHDESGVVAVSINNFPVREESYIQGKTGSTVFLRGAHAGKVVQPILAPLVSEVSIGLYRSEIRLVDFGINPIMRATISMAHMNEKTNVFYGPQGAISFVRLLMIGRNNFFTIPNIEDTGPIQPRFNRTASALNRTDSGVYSALRAALDNQCQEVGFSYHISVPIDSSDYEEHAIYDFSDDAKLTFCSEGLDIHRTLIVPYEPLNCKLALKYASNVLKSTLKIDIV